MANVTLHFSLGMLLGGVLAARSVMQALRARHRISNSLRRALILMYALGLYATIPHWLSRLGVADAFCNGWWMNLFFFYPTIGRLRPDGGALIGQVLFSLTVACQYVLLLVAIRRVTPKASS